MKQYTFYFDKGGSVSATGTLLTYDDQYVVKDGLGGEYVFPRENVLHYSVTPRNN